MPTILVVIYVALGCALFGTVKHARKPPEWFLSMSAKEQGKYISDHGKFDSKKTDLKLESDHQAIIAEEAERDQK